MTNFIDRVCDLFLPHGSEVMALEKHPDTTVAVYAYRDDDGKTQAAQVWLSLGEGAGDDETLADRAWRVICRMGVGNSAYRDDRPALIELH